jgi:hypothetical protein
MICEAMTLNCVALFKGTDRDFQLHVLMMRL